LAGARRRARETIHGLYRDEMRAMDPPEPAAIERLLELAAESADQGYFRGQTEDERIAWRDKVIMLK
jgi:hypothetical protein